MDYDPRTSEGASMQRATLCLCMLALIVLQIAFTDAYLPISEWFSSEGAIYSDDYSLYYGFSARSARYLEEFGKIWAYDPDMRAGSIATGNLTTISNNGWALFCYLLHSLLGLDFQVAFKLFFVLSTLCVPLVCYAAARNFSSSKGHALAAAALGTLLMHTSVTVNFYQWGSVSFVLVTYLAPLAVACFYRFCLCAQLKYLLYASFMMLCCLWLHLFSLPILAVPLFICYVLCFRRIRPTHHAAIVIALALVFLAYLPGVYPFIQLQDTIVKSLGTVFYANKSPWGPVRTYLLRDNLFNSYANMVFHKEEWIEIVLLLLGVLGLFRWYARRQKALAVMVATSAGFLLWLSYYGAFFDITNITPMRFEMSLNVLLVFPATAGLYCLYEIFLADKPRRVKFITAAVCGYMLLALIAPAYYHIFYRKAFRTVYRLPEPCKDLISWIKSNTNRDGRILLESSDFETNHQLYGGHIDHLFPLWTDREFVDSLFRYSPVADTFVSFISGSLFTRPVGSYTAEQLKAYFDLYNVKWLVYWSDESRKAFSSFGQYIVPVANFDKFHVCRVERTPTYFLKGSGASRSEANKIYLSDLQADGGEIVVSYHWMKFLRTDPPLELERVLYMDDPVGFIKLKNPPRSVLIYNSYK
jgi:hypothetical protein